MSIGFRQVLERLADGMAQGVRSTVDAIHEGKLAPLVADLGADVRTPFSWRVIVLPDTQCYVDVNKANNEKHIHRQTEWIVQEKDRGDIRYVLQLGDLTQHNSPLEWAKIRSAMSLLNGKVPYLVIPGNHDIGPGGNAYDRSTLMAAYFPVSDAIANSAFKGSFKKNEPENVYHIFSAGGVNWLLIGLEFGPRDEVVRWAQKLVDDHPGHRLILVTHAYLYDDNSRFDYKQKGVTQAGNPQYYHIMAEPGFANDGEQLWRDVVSRTKQPSLFFAVMFWAMV
jgi:hypothetical protein